MKAKKVTLLMVLTVISLLTIFLVLLLDDTVLAAECNQESKSNHESASPEMTAPEFIGGNQKIKEVMENATFSHKQSH